MKRFVITALCAALLAGCSAGSSSVTPSAAPKEETEIPQDIAILSPTGAPGYSLVPLLKEGYSNITFTDGSDALQAAFVNPDPQYDVIIAPTNLGAKLISAEKTSYKLAGIITTGNLYIVGEEGALDGNGTIALFGENAVPGMLYTHLFTEGTMQETWFNSVSEAQAALLSGNADAALLAEPAATATIAKGKETGKTFTKLADLQEKWGDSGYPMASLFVKEDCDSDVIYSLIQKVQQYSQDVTDGKENIQEDIDSLSDSSVLGATPSAMVAKAYAGMGIHPSVALDQYDNISEFLNLFSVSVSKEAFIQFDE